MEEAIGLGGAWMQKQERKQEHRREPQGTEEVMANAKVLKAGRKLTEDLDHLVDEIDDVLETNAEEFVKNYVQRGGE
jgi:prokaryotic ubiquitin-like protein Pup